MKHFDPPTLLRTSRPRWRFGEAGGDPAFMKLRPDSIGTCGNSVGSSRVRLSRRRATYAKHILG